MHFYSYLIISDYYNDNNFFVFVSYIFYNGIPLHQYYLRENGNACHSQYDMHSCACCVGVMTVVITLYIVLNPVTNKYY